MLSECRDSAVEEITISDVISLAMHRERRCRNVFESASNKAHEAAGSSMKDGTVRQVLERAAVHGQFVDNHAFVALNISHAGPDTMSAIIEFKEIQFGIPGITECHTGAALVCESDIGGIDSHIGAGRLDIPKLSAVDCEIKQSNRRFGTDVEC